MKKKAGENGAGASANEGKNNTDNNEHGDEAPGPAKLSAMHQSEEHAGDNHAGGDAEGFSEQRVEIAPKDGLLDKRRNQNSHSHEQNCGVLVAKELLDGDILGLLHFGGSQKNGERDSEAGQQINPGTARPAVLAMREISPA